MVLVELEDISDIITQSRGNLQKSFQAMLTNALSHERLTPLNSIINITEEMITYVNVQTGAGRPRNPGGSLNKRKISFQELPVAELREEKKEFHPKAKQNLEMVWSCSRQMQMMTESQLFHFQYNCDSLHINATRIEHQDFRSYLLDFCKPFQVNLENKSLRLVVESRIGPQVSVSKLCTDFRLYEGILYHLM